MNITNWARWIELGMGHPEVQNALDIRQVPELIQRLQNKFCGDARACPLYSGLSEIIEEGLPAPHLGCGFGRAPMSPQNTYMRKLFDRVEMLPLKDGDICMSASAFRLALIGQRAFPSQNSQEKHLFYQLGMKEKKYIIEKQPDLFPFRTDLPKCIGNSSLIEVLWSKNSPKDLFHDAALFGSDALFEGLKILREMVPQLCVEEADNLRKILSCYPSENGERRNVKNRLAYLLVTHQLELLEGKEIAQETICSLVDCMNHYCSVQDPDLDYNLCNLIFPGSPLKRAESILSWIQWQRSRNYKVFLPLTAMDKIILSKKLDISPSTHNPHLLMKEFDQLAIKEKKEFITKILLEKKIEVLPFDIRDEFIQRVEQRSSQPLSAIFRLALLSINFLSPNSTFKKALPRLQQSELLFEIQSLVDSDKIWFLENIFMHDACIRFYLKGENLPHFFNLLNDLKSCLGDSFTGSFLTILEERILELCSTEEIPFALLNLGCREKIIVCLKKYVSKNIAKGPFNQKLAAVCKKFFESTVEGIQFLLQIGILQTPSEKFLLDDPAFLSSVPQKYQQEIGMLVCLIQPLGQSEVDPLESQMKKLPEGLKELLLRETPFTTFFEQKVMGRLIGLYQKGCVPPEEMFFLATKLPHNIFLDVAEKCPIDFTKLRPIIQYGGVEDTIPGHVEAFCEWIIDGDRFAEDDFRKFLNRYPQQVIGEGRWIQYLARQVPTLYSIPVIQKIIELMPMDLIPYVVRYLEPDHQKWFLNPRFEPIYSKNIEKFSPEVLSWLLENLQKWFVIKEDVIEYTLFLWDRPKKSLKTKLDLLDETNTLFCLFQKRYSELKSLNKKLIDCSESRTLQSVLEKMEQVNAIITPWQKRMEEIDISSISDAVTQELLEGNVYSLEENGWILETTKNTLRVNPFNRSPFLSNEDKDQRVPPLNQEQMANLEDKRKKIVSQIASLRSLITEKEGSKKRSA